MAANAGELNVQVPVGGAVPVNVIVSQPHESVIPQVAVLNPNWVKSLIRVLFVDLTNPRRQVNHWEPSQNPQVSGTAFPVEPQPTLMEIKPTFILAKLTGSPLPPF